jgi:hypothetical protein
MTTLAVGIEDGRHVTEAAAATGAVGPQRVQVYEQDAFRRLLSVGGLSPPRANLEEGRRQERDGSK